MNHNYLTLDIKRLKDRGSRKLPSIMSQKELSVKVNIPPVFIRWAIEAGRLDTVYGSDNKRLVCANKRFWRWLKTSRKTLEKQGVTWKQQSEE